MPETMSRTKEEAFSNLKLDANFFTRALRADTGPVDASSDYDIYLMDNSVMPLLLQGLDALSRQVDKNANGGGLSGGGTAPFNPRAWLAQYLLRNHPGHVKDHRTPMYEQFREMASVERGRRYLLRRRSEMEDVWFVMERDIAQMKLTDIPEFMRRLDSKWGLEGTFSSRMPADFHGIIAVETTEDQVEQPVCFVDFWRWFEDFVASGDVLRASAFDKAEHRKLEAERMQTLEAEEARQREKAIQEVLEKRQALEDEFDALGADVYINTELARILNKGAVISLTDRQEGSLPLKGEHCLLLLTMLRLWGCPRTTTDGTTSVDDEWDAGAQFAWQTWLKHHGPQGASLQVDGQSIKKLIDRDAFEEYLHLAFPVNAQAVADEEMHRTVELRGIIDDSLDIIVEAVDEETGEILQLSLPDSQAPEARRRLAEQSQEDGGEPLFARVDLVSQRVVELIPSLSESAST